MLLVAGVTAQSTYRLDFDGIGERRVWIQEPPFTQPPEVTERTRSVALEMTAPGDVEGLIVVVHDLDQNTVATRELAQVLTTGRWRVSQEDVTGLYEFRVRVETEAGPVASAVVELDADGEVRNELLSVDQRGEVTFYNVPLGEIRVRARYNFEGRSRETSWSIFSLDPQMSTDERTVTILVDDPVAIAEAGVPESPTEATTNGGETVPASAPGTNWVGRIVTILFSLVVIGGFLYGAYWFLKSRPEQVKAQLQKIGVNLPDDAEAADASAHPAIPDKKQPVQKIVLGATPEAPDAAVPGTPAIPTVAGGPSTVANPRLVDDTGEVLLIGEGKHQVGREDSADVTVSDSSVSRRHATLERTEAGVTLQDAGSTNGTFVNGRPVSDAVALKPGDQVQFGTQRFRYEE